MRAIAAYFLDLGFGTRPEDLVAGSAPRRWAVLCYLLFCLGIVAREISRFPAMKLVEQFPGWRVPAAAFVVGLALFPPVLRWVSTRHEGRPRPSLEHVLWCFTFGFFWSAVAQQINDRFLQL